MSFDEFKERCGHDELPDKSDPYSWEVEEDFREWEAAETLKKTLLAYFRLITIIFVVGMNTPLKIQLRTGNATR